MNDFNLIWEFNNLYNTKILKKVIIKNNKLNNNVNKNLIEDKNRFTQSNETSYLLNNNLELYVNTPYDEKIQDKNKNGVSHTIIKEDDKNIIFTFGGYKVKDGYKSGTSESFSYFFTNLVYNYIFQVNNNEDINKIIITVNKIIMCLNLIFKLYNLTYKSNKKYINILLPIWQSYIDNGEIKVIDVNSGLLRKGDVGKYNATDSNQQLLLALFKLYFFNLENENNSLKYLCLITTGTTYKSKGISNNIEPILLPKNSILGITFKDDKISNILQKIIVIFIENVTLVKKFGQDSDYKDFPFSNGAFAKLSGTSIKARELPKNPYPFLNNYEGIFFSTGVQPVDIQQDNTLIDNYFGDYISPTMCLYILKYYKKYNIPINFNETDNINIGHLFNDKTIVQQAQNFPLSPIKYFLYALSNYFNWLNALTDITTDFEKPFFNNVIDEKGNPLPTKKDILQNKVENGAMNAFYTRLLFQITEFLVLLNKGDNLLLFKEKSNSTIDESKTFAITLWNEALKLLTKDTTILTDVINQLANNLFNIEINFDTNGDTKGVAYKTGLSFGFDQTAATSAHYFIGSQKIIQYLNGALSGQGYYRLVLYLILIKLGIIKINNPRTNILPDKSSGDYYINGNFYVENMKLEDLVSFKNITKKDNIQPMPAVLENGSNRNRISPPYDPRLIQDDNNQITINYFRFAPRVKVAFFFGAEEKWWDNSGSYFDFYMMLINLTVFFCYNGNNLKN